MYSMIITLKVTDTNFLVELVFLSSFFFLRFSPISEIILFLGLNDEIEERVAEAENLREKFQF
jgi:hypothetical protein